MRSYTCPTFVHVIQLSVHPHVGDYVHLPFFKGCPTKPCHAAGHMGFVTVVPSDDAFTMLITLTPDDDSQGAVQKPFTWTRVREGHATSSREET